MIIDDPIKAFNLTEDQAKAFAEKLHKAAKRREASWVDGDPIGHYTMSINEAAEYDTNVSYALSLSWNESLAFAAKWFSWE